MTRKRSDQKDRKKKSGGAMRSLRGGFKNTARSLTGKSKKSRSVDWLINLLILAMVIYLVYRYFIQ
ncbi:MAG: hypothetical protein PF689_12695 [Deltaproteobacteria bacterium]|nr:hypothetical protein [Deltaproteobacteria bacterium]